MSLDVTTLRQSFDRIAERNPEMTFRFYDILFERYPQAKPLFARTNPMAQTRMLSEALRAVLVHLEDGAWLERTLKGLGARHVNYGVTEPMYAWVGDALLRTLAEVEGDDWTESVAKAWTDAYGAIASLMLAGAAEEEAKRAAKSRPVLEVAS
ncbi:MAG: flavohemoprotein [Polyangiaceae bacterium]|nr:flavohemoprotein [Polyangiaceae bacterium]